MPSPFPGMNPYFEQPDLWQDFHQEFLGALRGHIVPQVYPDFIVQLEEHLFIHALPPEPRRPVGRADISVATRRDTLGTRTVIELLEAPAEVYLPDLQVERHYYLEIRDRRGRELVAVIELLSPSNKRRGDDRLQYLGKRRKVLKSAANFIEIDLLRGDEAMPMEGRPECEYSVLVSRAERRPAAEFWPIRLRDRLPVIPIPLHEGAGDVRIDLQDVLHETYDRPGYESFLYDGDPHPSLSADDLQWALGFVPKTL